MNITFLIGNGFDVNLGLKTRYIDFYKYFSSLESAKDSAAVKKFKKEITEYIKDEVHNTSEDCIDWRDLEVALGKWSKYLNEDDIDDFHISIIDSLKDYLKNEYKYFDPKIFEEHGILKYLLDPISGNFNRNQSNEIMSYWRQYPGPDLINIINFNYTLTIEHLCGIKKKPLQIGTNIAGHTTTLSTIHHIHQTLNDEDILVGLNDVSQIENKVFHNNRHICNLMVKPYTNVMLGTGIDRDCEDIISSTDLFVLFGTSAGITDQKWWKAICNRIKDYNARLLYFVHGMNRPHMGLFYDTMSEDVIRSLLSSAGLKNDTAFASVYPKSYICFTPGLFDIKPTYSEIPNVRTYHIDKSDVTITILDRGTKHLTLSVNAPNEETGVHAEHMWIKEYFPDHHETMQSLGNYLVQEVELPFDHISIISKDNSKELYFEISSFFGKSNHKLIALPSESQRSSAFVNLIKNDLT